MARITPNTDTTFTTTTTITTATTITLPENARILVVDNDTEAVTADVNVTDIASLTIGSDDVHVVDHNATNSAADNTVSDADADDEDAVFAAAVIAEMLGMLDPEGEAEADDEAESDTDTDADAKTGADDEAESDTEPGTEPDAKSDAEPGNADTDTDAATPAITVNRSIDGDDTIYRISINYDSVSGTYTDAANDAMVVGSHFITLIKRACEHNADAYMSFDIPGRGFTTFDGKLQENYGNFTGIVLVAPNGGAYVLDDTDCLTDDMMVLSTATFTFKTEDGEDDEVFANFVEAANGEDELFAGLSVNIVDDAQDLGDPNEGNDDDFAEEDYEDDDLDDDDYEDDDLDVDLDDDEDDTEDDDDASDTTDAAPNTTIDPDVKFCATVWADEHFLENKGIRRVFRYAADHNFSATLSRNLAEDPYVGKLYASDEGDDAIYTLVDKKRGDVEINLDGTGTYTAGFYALTIYSDDKMRRRGFAGTNHEEYAKVSLSEMIERIDDLRSV